MKLSNFYRQYTDLARDLKFKPIVAHPQMVSLFVIYKQLEGVQAQLRYFEMRKEELLAQAEEGFKQLAEAGY